MLDDISDLEFQLAIGQAIGHGQAYKLRAEFIDVALVENNAPKARPFYDPVGFEFTVQTAA